MRTVPVNNGPVVFDEDDIVDVLTSETEYVVPYPGALYETHVLFEPRAENLQAGEGALFVVGPRVTPMPELVTPTHTESGAIGTYGITVRDLAGIATDLYYRTKVGPAAWGSWTLKTATPTHGISYSETVALVEKHPSYIEFRLDLVMGGEAFSIYSQSAGMDLGFVANVTQCVPRFVNDRLWLLLAGDSDTREDAETIIGHAGETIDTEPTLLDYTFTLKHKRIGEVNTGIDVTQEVGTVSGLVAVRAIDKDGTEGPVYVVPYHREGSGAGSVSINTLLVTFYNGTNCGDPATCDVEYDVTAPGGYTVSLERYIDGALDDTVLVDDTTLADTFVDEQEFVSGGGIITRDVQYRIVVKSGSTVVSTQWSETVRFYDVADCP
jgi:hypothetical protein